MPRAIDHVVHASRDLAAQAAFYQRLGFTVGARNHHPWGTENHIIQFPDHFLELIGQGAGFKAPVDLDPHVFSFAGFVAQELALQDGASMLALQTRDAMATRGEFKASGAGDFAPFHFERKGRKADGSDSHVAFTLAFAQSKLMPHVGLFACQHHYRQDFYAPDWQIHPNGAVGVSGLVLVAENPSAHAEFLSAVTGQREMLATSMGIDLEVADGQSIEVLTRPAFIHRFGATALGQDNPEPRIAACRIAVRDLSVVTEILQDNDIAAERVGQRLVVSPGAAFGLALAFEAVTD
jgi:hypothetical protein